MTYKLPELNYAYDALEPVIDAQTMEIHHSKHHQAYVNNLNAALEDQAELANLAVEELIRDLSILPEAIQTAVRNNGGGHYNHSLFWQMLRAPQDDNDATIPADLRTALEEAFGSLDSFKETFQAAAAGRFGSGWGWLVQDPNQGLIVTSTPNQDSPVMDGQKVLLGVDVWEHAYYLHYQNRRPEYLSNFWKIVDWNKVAEWYRV